MKRTETGVKCLECNDEIYSEYRHDYRTCRCGKAFIDGGSDYLRYGAENLDRIKAVEREIENGDWLFKKTVTTKKGMPNLASIKEIVELALIASHDDRITGVYQDEEGVVLDLAIEPKSLKIRFEV